MTNDDIIDRALEYEGGYVDNSNDPGGQTNFGITEHIARAAGYTGDMKALSIAVARTIYLQRFIMDTGFHAITSGEVRWVIVDAGINEGPAAATRLAQRAVGVAADGQFGPVTLAAIEAMEPFKCARRILAERTKLVGRLVSGHPRFIEFVAGWCARVADQQEALA